MNQRILWAVIAVAALVLIIIVAKNMSTSEEDVAEEAGDFFQTAGDYVEDTARDVKADLQT
jgi:hypothetical protein